MCRESKARGGARQETTASRAHQIFAALGLRHLCVTDYHNQLVGLITRKDLTQAEMQYPEGHIEHRQLTMPDRQASLENGTSLHAATQASLSCHSQRSLARSILRGSLQTSWLHVTAICQCQALHIRLLRRLPSILKLMHAAGGRGAEVSECMIVTVQSATNFYCQYSPGMHSSDSFSMLGPDRTVSVRTCQLRARS